MWGLGRTTHDCRTTKKDWILLLQIVSRANNILDCDVPYDNVCITVDNVTFGLTYFFGWISTVGNLILILVNIAVTVYVSFC